MATTTPPVRSPVVTLADGVARKLVFDIEALVVIEDLTGSLSAYSEGLVRGLRGRAMKSVRAGLIAGLSYLQGQEALTPYRITQMMRFDDLKDYIEALDAAWAEMMPKETN